MIKSTAEESRRLWDWWANGAAIVLTVLFVVVFSWLMFRKHGAFNTRTYDLARFDQAIWNTLHGRFLFSTIGNQSILGNHFSPFLAALAPLFLVWDDVRVLFVVQTVSVAVAGLFLYKMVRCRHPSLAPLALLAFYLNPTLHEVTLFEFRRDVPGMPFLAMAFYGLYSRKRWLMMVGLGLALLCKEDVGFIVFMVGFYLLVFARDWKWGIPTMVLGGAWVVVVSLWVIPAFAPAKNGPSVYPQLYYYDYLGSSYQAVADTLLRQPMVLFQRLFSLERLLALGRVLLPLGFVLPFLAPEWLLICLPSMAYMLMSNEPTIYRLEEWHTAFVLPVFFAAIAVGLGRISERWARWLVLALLVSTGLGYLLFSPAPLGGKYDPALYKVTEHHRLADQVIAAVPAKASVATQALYVPHLSHREQIYHYPWIVIGLENTDYLVLDRHSNPYPFTPDGINEEIDNLLADPGYVVELEADGIYLFRRRVCGALGPCNGTFPVNRTIDHSMYLLGVEVAVQDQAGLLRPVGNAPIELIPGQQLRVDLYWQAVAVPNAERTVSVRIADSSGALVAQHDGWPGQGKKPTSWWQEGWKIRDVHYLAISPEARPGSASLDVLVYDSHSQDIVPYEDGSKVTTVCEVSLLPRP